jgi:hypothetical protein
MRVACYAKLNGRSEFSALLNSGRKAHLRVRKRSPHMFSNDWLNALNGGDSMSHHLDRSRNRAGVRRRASTTDVNAFLDASGIKGRKR